MPELYINNSESIFRLFFWNKELDTLVIFLVFLLAIYYINKGLQRSYFAWARL